MLLTLLSVVLGRVSFLCFRVVCLSFDGDTTVDFNFNGNYAIRCDGQNSFVILNPEVRRYDDFVLSQIHHTISAMSKVLP